MVDSDSAFAKINISLDIKSKMADGYHDMLMVMQSVGLTDEITVECVPGNGIGVDTGFPYIPSDERNIAVKAASAFFVHTGIYGFQTSIRLNKNIPVCAGLGGGSADGACVLRILNRMFNTSLSKWELETIGREIGSDVPFCVAGGTVLATGRGDVMSKLPSINPCSVVICKPQFSFSTPELFAKIRCEKIRARPDTDGILASLKSGDLQGVARRMYNVFEDVLPRGEKEIAAIKYSMLDDGALGAIMTGTGSAVFGIFDCEENAKKSHERLQYSYKDCYLTGTTEEIIFPIDNKVNHAAL